MNKKWAISLCSLLLTCMAVVLNSYAVAETATATDSELVVARDLIQATTAQQSNQAKVTEPRSQITTADDMSAEEYQRSLPTLNQPLIDQTKILTAEERQAITEKILSIYQSGQAQIGVIVIASTGQEDIFTYALRAAEAWGLGSAKRDNGLIIVVALQDRRIQILTGYGLEGVIPDIVAGQIIRNHITAHFQNAEYALGILSGLNEIERILQLDPDVAAQAAQDLREQQEQIFQAEKAKKDTIMAVMIILVVAVIASLFVGQKLSAATAAVAGTVAGLVNGMGLVWSLIIGVAIFFLIITTLAQIIFQAILSGAARGGSGGGLGGGGYSGGGGGFGGGGASGSW